jgi:UrcA family protein
MLKTANCASPTLLGLALASIIAAAPCPATSEPLASQRSSVAVPYGDLDLTTKAGQQVLKQRVRHAAREVCDRVAESNLPTDAQHLTCQQAVVHSVDVLERQAIAEANARAHWSAPGLYAAVR